MNTPLDIKCFLFYLIVFYVPEFLEGKERVKKSLLFPETSLWGLFVAIAVPVDIPEPNIFVSYNFEANYGLPQNTSSISDLTLFTPITDISARSRSFDRRQAYTILEDRFNKSGYPGRECVLRSICEAAETPLDHNGVLGGIMHVIFTPSSSKDESLSSVYYLAEKHGSSGDCEDYVEQCPAGLLDSISKVLPIFPHQ